MQAYIIRRLLALIPTLIFASLIVFITVRLIPGDIIDLMLSSNDIGADKKSRAQLEAALGLDRPMFSQYFLARAILFEAARQSLCRTSGDEEIRIAPIPSSAAMARSWRDRRIPSAYSAAPRNGGRLP